MWPKILLEKEKCMNKRNDTHEDAESFLHNTICYTQMFVPNF